MEETKFDRAKYMGSHRIEGQPLPSANQVQAELDSKDGADGKQDGDQEAARTTTTLSHVEGPRNGLDEQFKKKSRLARLKPIERENLRGKNQLIKLIIRPILLLLFPIISYSGFIYGSNIIWLSVLNATESMVLSNEPYNMSTSTVGLTFIAPLIGTTLA